MATIPQNTTAASGGEVYVAGCGHDGRLGTGNEKNQHRFVALRSIPPPPPTPSVDSGNNGNSSVTTAPTTSATTVKEAIVGGFHTFIITADDRVLAFGLNEYGQLGLDSKAPCVKVAQLVPFFERRRKKSTTTTTILTEAAASGTESLSSVEVSSSAPPRRQYSPQHMLAPSVGLIDLHVGTYHTVAWCDDGVYVCGANDHGQLGLGDFDHRFGFVCLIGDDEVTSSSMCSSDTPTKQQQHRRAASSSAAATDVLTLRGAFKMFTPIDNNNKNCGGSSPKTLDFIHSIGCGSFHTMIVGKNVAITAAEKKFSLARIGGGEPETKSKSDIGNNNNGSLQHATTTRKRADLSLITGASSNATSPSAATDPSSPHDQLRQMIDMALKTEEEEEANGATECCTIPFALFSCGKGDFGELGYDADEWDKLGAMEKRLKQHVSNKAAFMAQGGKAEDFADFNVGGSAAAKIPTPAAATAPSVAAASPFMKLKPKPTFGVSKSSGGGGGVNTKPPPPAPIVRRSEFSSHTCKRVSFPLLDALSLDGGIRQSEARRLQLVVAGGEGGDDDDAVKGTRATSDDGGSGVLLTVTNVVIKPQHHHTIVDIHYQQHEQKKDCVAIFHFGCHYANKVETIESSIPRRIVAISADLSSAAATASASAADDNAPPPPRIESVKMAHAGDEIFFTVLTASSSSSSSSSSWDELYVVGKGNLGCNDDDDFVVEEETVTTIVDGITTERRTQPKRGKPLALPLPPSLAAAASSAHYRYKILSIAGRTHFFIKVRWFTDNVEAGLEEELPPYIDVMYVFGDNYMGQCALNSDENAILVPTIVPSFGAAGTTIVPSVVGCGNRHSVAIVPQ